MYTGMSRFLAPRGVRRVLQLAALLALVAVAPVLTVSAQGAPAFAGGSKVGGDTPYKYTAGPYTNSYQDKTYLYGTADNGSGYYATYGADGWSTWQGWGSQPAKYQYQPAALTYNGKQYVFYDGQDNHIYHNSYDGQAWQGWDDQSAQYTFPYSPYANVYGNKAYLYGVASDNTLYYKAWDGTAWSDWAAVSGPDAPAASYRPYAVDWGGQENVFYTGQDGKVYWNRYDGNAWSGVKALPGDYQFGYAPYAVGYAPEQKLYAYAVAKDGTPYYSSFTDGQGWSGWTGYSAAPPAKVQYQPSAYVYQGAQHVVYTGTDGHAYYNAYQNGSWGGWQDLGGNYAYSPYQFEAGSGYYLTYTGQDGYVYAKPYAGGGAVAPLPTKPAQPAYGYPTPTPGY